MTDQSDLSIPVLDVEKIKDSTRFYESALKRYRDAAADLDAAAADLYLATRPNISISSPSTNGSPGESDSEQAPAGGGAGEGGGKGRPSKKPTKPKPKKPKRTKAPNKPKKSSTSKPVEKVNTVGAHPVVARLNEHLASPENTMAALVKASGISQPTLSRIKRGASVADVTLEKLGKCLDTIAETATKKKKHPEYSKPEKNEPEPAKSLGEDEANVFLAAEIKSYIGNGDIQISAMELGISVRDLENIQIGIFPTVGVIEQLAKRIPAIDKVRRQLVAYAKKARK